MHLFKHAKRGTDREVGFAPYCSTSRDGHGAVNVRAWFNNGVGSIAYKLLASKSDAEAFIVRLADAAAAFDGVPLRCDATLAHLAPAPHTPQQRNANTAALLRRLADMVERGNG